MQGEDQSKRMRPEAQLVWPKGLGDEFSRRSYTYEDKLAAVRLHLEEGATAQEAMERYGIRSKSAFFRWCNAYKDEGSEALRPKRRGRPPKNRE